ncbi:hypothetical protein CTAM01_11609 [Colletotrichum tamarilloi]|uniref:C2H2-type domain-containing protein n=1 Tax=Colletotrichum tamarilloi TaxID=1209934 RepID=A0ABQ9QX59_9PEZI|nr:uncharacterized protein CTAM01_11609 [Colletotrichum tamarilloi]KAK1488063.1 hypothetical protein CTAM01_11609 [Colletotrichum tamarilloi]
MTEVLNIQCHVCSLQFSTPDLLQQHVWHYQAEIAAMLTRLHDLFAHHDPTPNITISTDTCTSSILITDPKAVESANDAQPRRLHVQNVKLYWQESKILNDTTQFIISAKNFANFVPVHSPEHANTLLTSAQKADLNINDRIQNGDASGYAPKLRRTYK